MAFSRILRRQCSISCKWTRLFLKFDYWTNGYQIIYCPRSPQNQCLHKWFHAQKIHINLVPTVITSCHDLRGAVWLVASYCKHNLIFARFSLVYDSSDQQFLKGVFILVRLASPIHNSTLSVSSCQFHMYCWFNAISKCTQASTTADQSNPRISPISGK